MSTYHVCEACGETFRSERSEEDAQVEARAAFTEEELADAAVVCDDCWNDMRSALPELDERYA